MNEVFERDLTLDELKNVDWYSIDYSNISDSDYVFLENRGRYLTEYIDKLENLASYKEIEELPKDGSYIIPWGPSRGKTSAIRKFIVEHRLEYGIYATKKISDIDMLYIDILAQSKYLRHQTISIIKFHSGTEEYPQYLLSDKLSSSFWILCTHERLFIEPQEMIYFTRRNIADIKSRDYLIIDEYPSTLYKRIKTEDSFSLLAMESMSDLKDSDNKYGVVKTLVDGCYSDSIKVPRPMIGVIDTVPTPTNQSYKLDKQRGFNSIESIKSKNRISFFAYYFYSKSKEELEKKAEDQSQYLYYSVFDLPPTTKYIFDGTGDILFNGSNKFKLTDSNYPRSLSVDKLSRVESKITRKSNLEDIVIEYSTIINNICKYNPDSNILVYTWKSSRDDSYVYRCDEEDINNNDIPKLIYDKLSSKDKNRVNIIHYQSGKERVTSEYKNSDILVILGEFYIPTSVIADIKSITETKSLTTADFTESLIVQCIYRTQARIGNPIKIYYSGYNSDFIYKCLLDCNLKSDVKEVIEDLGNSDIDDKLSIEMMNLNLYHELLSISEDGKITTSEITKFFNHKNFDSRNINNKLDKGNIPYKYYPATQTDKSKWTEGYYLIDLKFSNNLIPKDS